MEHIMTIEHYKIEFLQLIFSSKAHFVNCDQFFFCSETSRKCEW